MVTLLTGGSGFVGSAVARKLVQRNVEVRALARPTSDLRNLQNLPVEVVRGDLNDPASLAKALQGVDSLYHVAADYRLWVKHPREIYSANVDGTRTLFALAAEAGVKRAVYTSSVCTLGLLPQGVPADETTPVKFSDMIGHYKKSKFLAEKIVKDFSSQGFDVVVVHPSTPIGPGDVKPTPTGRMIREAATGKMPAYVDTGLNLVHVDDVAEGHIQAFEKGRSGESYILGGENLSLGEILREIAFMTGRKPPKICLPRGPIFPIAFMAEGFSWLTNGKEPFVTLDGLKLAKKKMFFSSDKARRELGYTFRPVQAALEDAISFFDVPLATGTQFQHDGYPAFH